MGPVAHPPPGDGSGFDNVTPPRYGLPMKRIVNTRSYLYLEIALLMLGLPLALATILPLRYMLPTLWLSALYCHMVYRLIVDVPSRIGWGWQAVNWQNMKPLLRRFALSAALLVALTLWLKPEMFLSFVRERPLFWAVVMVAYPLLSVIPQEIIFRSFFFARYTKLFPAPAAMVIASGVMFGAAHLIFYNWVAPALCLIGGIMFAQTYGKTRSLAMACIEHAMYGCFLFTLGLGRYFYHGAVGPQ